MIDALISALQAAKAGSRPPEQKVGALYDALEDLLAEPDAFAPEVTA